MGLADRRDGTGVNRCVLGADVGGSDTGMSRNHEKTMRSFVLIGAWSLVVWFLSGWVYANQHCIDFWHDHATHNCQRGRP